MRLKVKQIPDFLAWKGLLGKKTAEVVVFHTRFGIHTFGMHFPIDVLILNQNTTVVAIKQALMPNRLFFWNPRYNTVMELPQGWIERHNIKQGSKLSLEYF